MRLPLKPHPDGPQLPIIVDVELSRSPGRLALLYVVSGEIGGLSIPAPAPAPAARTDGLWQHTCFEAFFRVPGDDSYGEVNIAPSGAWAAYGFESYRAGMIPADMAALRSVTRRTERVFTLETQVEVPPGPLRLGLSAVIEEQDGRKSYWALAHPAAKPDFHHPDSFVCELP